MTIWAIADIHASPLDASGDPRKPMGIFGEQWEEHVERIEAAWNDSVEEGDTVVVAGDLDWSLHLEDAVATLERVGRWKGRKLLVRGNHDYWWSSKATSKVRKVLPPSVDLIHNNAHRAESFNIVGAKGSAVPGSLEWTDVDAKLLNRELERLKLSLAGVECGLPTIAALHYPPFFPASGTSPYVDVLQQSFVSMCIYGHLHGEGARSGPRGEFGGIRYVLAAADYVGFRPVRIAAQGELVVSD